MTEANKHLHDLHHIQARVVLRVTDCQRIQSFRSSVMSIVLFAQLGVTI